VLPFAFVGFDFVVVLCSHDFSTFLIEHGTVKPENECSFIDSLDWLEKLSFPTQL